MSYIDTEIRMFYELYKIPIKYREIMREIIIKNRILRQTFNKILFYCIQNKKLRDQLQNDWEIIRNIKEEIK